MTEVNLLTRLATILTEKNNTTNKTNGSILVFGRRKKLTWIGRTIMQYDTRTMRAGQTMPTTCSQHNIHFFVNSISFWASFQGSKLLQELEQQISMILGPLISYRLHFIFPLSLHFVLLTFIFPPFFFLREEGGGGGVEAKKTH